MSRIGKLPIEIPAGVTITVNNGEVTVKGAKGELKQKVNPAITVQVEDGTCLVTRTCWGWLPRFKQWSSIRTCPRLYPQYIFKFT